MTLLAATGGARRRAAPPTYPLPASPTNYTLATPDGTNQTVHPSVVDMVAETGQPLSGYRWWMANTPYPPDAQENPCIWASNDRVTWVVPPGVSNPIAPQPPPPQVSSDTELVWDPDGQRLVVWWRTYGIDPIEFNAAMSMDGISWSLQGTLGTWATATGRGNHSPTLARKGVGDWYWWNLGGVPIKFTGPSALGPWTEVGDCVYPGSAWHGDVIRYQGYWLMVSSNASANYRCYPAISTDDGVTWIVGPEIAEVGYTYRPTMAPSTVSGMMDLWVGRPGETYFRFPDSLWLDLLP